MSVLILAAAMALQVQVYTAQPAQPRPRPPATTTAPTGGEGGAALATGAQPERVVCHSEPVTGSRFPRRVCRTESQIEADRVESREMLRKIQRLPDIPA